MMFVASDVTPGVQEDRRQKCEAIEAAALELFVERGFDGTTVPEIAKRAGVGTGTLYLYHASKDDLLNALFVRWNATFFEGLAGAVQVGMSPRERFSAHWNAAVRFGQQYPVAFAFLMDFHGSPYLTEASRQRVVGMKAPLVAMFLEGIEERVFKPVPPDLLRAVCVGVLRETRALAVQGVLVTPELWRAAEAMAWDAIRYDGATLSEPLCNP
jgi:TetR/AcrR family transcriptional regulator, repressor of fatR-cypB operon